MFPWETGGVLMGYWAEPLVEVVITNAIGPGPKAIHKEKGFAPDAEYQEKEIANIYEASGRLSTYLGDWHTHPRGSTRLSIRDKRTLRRIAVANNARCPVPIMAVLGGGGKDKWLLEIWQYKYQKLPSWLFGIGVIPLLPNLYED